MTKEQANAITDESIQIWDKPYRAPGLKESATAFETFIIYRDMGVKRTINAVIEQTGLNHHNVKQWSYKYKWNDRINAMNQYKSKENQRINKEIKKKEINRINKRLDAKSNLLNVIIQVLMKNARKYENEQLDFKEFSNMLNLVTRIENMNIADLENLKNIEQELSDDGVDAQNINALVNNFNVLLSANNSDAIDKYMNEIKDDEY